MIFLKSLKKKTFLKRGEGCPFKKYFNIDFGEEIINEEKYLSIGSLKLKVLK